MDYFDNITIFAKQKNTPVTKKKAEGAVEIERVLFRRIQPKETGARPRTSWRRCVLAEELQHEPRNSSNAATK
jgi:hypothetical protein